ncbi:1-deoxy-D-xylulose-5-phosphate reductoisomerase [Thalassoglobus polymorphus]|uniref:1-deoxy-D-xylulose-5-phosphate reductoisomerase n=1 Tax=Thalassoglobus polymorphus TaxID=2527994 RepID=UPI001E460555|nr:1-deoxy-D-xylulose-5-phosphate reductoisomerase [Thalassoglobus polymorphus]
MGQRFLSDSKKRIGLLGATGSIGTSCLEVVRAHSESMSIDLLSAHSSWRELARSAAEFLPQTVVLTGVQASDVAANAFPSSVEVLYGEEALLKAVEVPEIETVITGIVGAAGLRGTLAAVEAGKRIGLANKETLVVAGSLVTQKAVETGSVLIPVDSEHSAIFQALACGKREDVSKLILTASGGPFRSWSAEKIAQATVANALDHPTWDMGPKITIDSATMMNKALEVIEARWLFGINARQIEVVVHPQSIVHSMVEFVDGSVMAQLSPPDMKLPIQYAITWPDRIAGTSPKLDISQTFSLDFEPPDLERFPALALGFEVADQGGTAGVVLNAANEVAVDRFLQDQLTFPEIPRLCRSILASHQFESNPTLDELLTLDGWARQEALRWTSSTSHSSPSLTAPRC